MIRSKMETGASKGGTSQPKAEVAVMRKPMSRKNPTFGIKETVRGIGSQQVPMPHGVTIAVMAHGALNLTAPRELATEAEAGTITPKEMVDGSRNTSSTQQPYSGKEKDHKMTHRGQMTIGKMPTTAGRHRLPRITGMQRTIGKTIGRPKVKVTIPYKDTVRGHRDGQLPRKLRRSRENGARRRRASE